MRHVQKSTFFKVLSSFLRKKSFPIGRRQRIASQNVQETDSCHFISSFFNRMEKSTDEMRETLLKLTSVTRKPTRVFVNVIFAEHRSWYLWNMFETVQVFKHFFRLTNAAMSNAKTLNNFSTYFFPPSWNWIQMNCKLSTLFLWYNNSRLQISTIQMFWVYISSFNWKNEKKTGTFLS